MIKYVFQHVVDCVIYALVFSWIVKLFIFLAVAVLGLQSDANFLLVYGSVTVFCFCVGCLHWLYCRFVGRKYQSVLGCFFVWWDTPNINTRVYPSNTHATLKGEQNKQKT